MEIVQEPGRKLKGGARKVLGSHHPEMPEPHACFK
jgi:hypothetical protein